MRGRISAETFLQLLNGYEQLVRQINRLGGYASLRFSQDTQDQQAQIFQAQMGQTFAEISNRFLFFEIWWKDVDDSVAQRLMADSGDFRYWLDSIRRSKPFTLTEEIEQTINLKDVNGRRALTQLYAAITNRYTFHLTIDGEDKEMTREEISSYVRSTDPDLRAASFKETLRVYGQDASILGMIYQALVRDWRSEKIDTRGFDSPISVRNLVNDIPDAAIDTLLDVAQRNAVIFQRYFRLKAKHLGVEKLRRYDLYAPISASDAKYDYSEAVEMVLKSFHNFDPQMGEMAQRVFDEHRVDSEVRQGKRGGAFCLTVEPTLTPWVLQSYNGTPRNVATMAHELGHAVHSMLAAGHSAFGQRASLPLAETASTFGEMLLLDHLLSAEPGQAIERDLLFSQMDSTYATVMRQIFFALFEREAHEQIAKGASVDELSERYLENLKTQFGDSVELSDDFKHEWVGIPHIYNVPFYVYAYSFGQLLVFSLYQQFKQEGDGFKPRYLAILAAGGSDSPANILGKAGIDITSAEFWQGGFDIIEQMVARLESLPAAA